MERAKKILAILLGVMLTVTLLPATARAAGMEYDASSQEDILSAIVIAMSIPSDVTINLTTDIDFDCSYPIYISRISVTFNLNDHKLNVSFAGTALQVENGGNVSVNSGGPDGELDVSSSGYGGIAVWVDTSSSATVTNASSAGGSNYAVYATGGGNTVTVLNNVTASGDFCRGVYTDTGGTTVMVGGSVTVDGDFSTGAMADGGGSITVNGNTTATTGTGSHGALADGGGIIHVLGDATANGDGSYGAHAYCSWGVATSIQVDGNAEATGLSSVGAGAAGTDCTIEVGGAATATGQSSYGTVALDGGTIHVSGDATADGDSSYGAYVSASISGSPPTLIQVGGNAEATGTGSYGAVANGTNCTSSKIEVGQEAIGNGQNSYGAYAYNGGIIKAGAARGAGQNSYGAKAGSGGNITVSGDVTANGNGSDNSCYGAFATGSQSQVTVNGNVQVSGSDLSCGAVVSVGGTVTVGGTITAPVYIVIWYIFEAASDGVQGTDPYQNYLIYTDNTSTVRVRIPATVPGTPQGFTATPGDAQVALNWSAPASDGGSTITKYQVSDNGTSWTDVTSGTSYTFSGLTNGQSYTFEVRAVNGVGNSAAATTTATPQAAAAVPGTPQSFTATPGDTQVTLNWSAPASDGGSPITKYQVSDDSGTSWTDVTSGTSYTFTGLTNGQSYTFEVRAVNGVGNSAAATATATPQAAAAVPGTPRSFTATPGDTQVTLNWSAPTSDGGSPITKYQVSDDSGTSWTDVTSGTSYTFSGLTNGQSYTFEVCAVNGVGNSAAATTVATPVVAPVPVTGVSLSSATLSMTLGGPDQTLTTTVAPPDATDRSVTWISLNNTIATVSTGGLVHAVAAGTVLITATTTDGGYMDACEVTVNAAQVAHDITVLNDGNGTGSAAVSSAVAGAAITLTATPNTGYHFKKWQIVSPVNLAVTGKTFTMPDEAVTVKAIFEADTVTTYTVTFSSDGSTYAAKTVQAGASIGSTEWPANPTKSGYTFGGWFTGTNGSGSAFTPTTPVNTAMTVYAEWTADSGGGGSGTPATGYRATVSEDGAKSTLPVNVNTPAGSASVEIGSRLAAGIAGGGIITIDVPSIPNIGSYTVSIPADDLSAAGGIGTLTLNTGAGSVTLPSDMLANTAGAAGTKAEVTVGQGDKSGLKEIAKAAIGDRPLIRLSMSIDGTQTEWNNPDAPVTVAIPYTPIADELANPESIVIWYIDGSGSVIAIPNGHYDPTTGMVTFSTTHFSLYAVAYNKVNFNDVAAGAWYNKAVSFIAARGITTGTGNGNYSPAAKLTRGEFIVLMMRAYGIAPDTNATDNFFDAGNTYYTGYLAAAKCLGISAGVGNNLYAPGKEITRQEMFTLLYNALKVIGQLPQGNSGKTLSNFIDARQIESWSKEAMTTLVETGAVGGNNGKLTPTNTTTRVEIAQVLYNLLAK